MTEEAKAPDARAAERAERVDRAGRADRVGRAGRAEPLEHRVAASLAALLPEYPRVSLCVAFSGGVDSTALLAALAKRRVRTVRAPARRAASSAHEARSAGARGPWPRLRAVHVHHGLHPDSDRWAEHCRAVAGRLGVPLHIVRIEVHRPRGASLEAAAREARYAALAAELGESEVLLTAQHADDQLETVLLQLLRGSGLRGLAAMPAIAPFARGRLARPLLACERAEIESWARARRLAWIEDSSNADERLDRNYLRRRIVPVLRARWPAVGRAVSRSARHAAEAQRLLDLLARADVERAAVGDGLSVPRLRALEVERRRNALRYWIARQGGPLPDARRLAELAGPVLSARPDARPQVAWGDTMALREGERLCLMRRARPPGGVAGSPAPVQAPGLEWMPLAPAVLELPGGCGRLELISDPHGPIDLDALPPRLSVRLRRGGERLRLRRGGSSRALKTLLQEARIPREERARMPLLWSEGHLLAAGDLWADAAIRAGADARRRGRFVWHRAPHIC